MLSDSGLDIALGGVDDAFLVARAIDGEVRAFGTLLRRHEQTLRRSITRLHRRAADVDDVLQETALKAWQNLDTVSDPSKVRAWMIRIATRESLRVATSRRREVELADDDAMVDGPEQEAHRLDTWRALQDALDALPQQQAQSWVLRELGGYSYREIAEQLAIPESTVRGSLAAARKVILASLGVR